MKKLLFVLFALCALFSLTTCQTLMSALQEPVVSFHSVELTGVNFTGAQLLCKVQVENPNGFNIPFPEVDWEFFINTNSFVSGVIKNNERLKARSTTIVEIPVSVEYLEVFNTFTSFKGRKEVDYKVALALKFNIPVLGDKVWKFEPNGSIPLPQAPKFATPSFNVESTDLTRAVLAVSVNVENPNIFPLPAPKVSYELLVNRNSFLKNTLEADALPASSTTPVTFRVTVNYADLLRAFTSLITSSSVSCQVNTSWDFAVPVFSGDNFNLQVPGNLPIRR